MHRSGELNIQSGIIFRQHVMAIGLLSHFDIGNGIFAALQILHFRSCIFRRVVDERDRNDCGQPTSKSARVEKIETHLRSAAVV